MLRELSMQKTTCLSTARSRSSPTVRPPTRGLAVMCRLGRFHRLDHGHLLSVLLGQVGVGDIVEVLADGAAKVPKTRGRRGSTQRDRVTLVSRIRVVAVH